MMFLCCFYVKRVVLWYRARGMVRSISNGILRGCHIFGDNLKNKCCSVKALSSVYSHI